MNPSRSFRSLTFGLVLLLAVLAPRFAFGQSNEPANPAMLDGTVPHRMPGVFYVQFREGYNPILQQGLTASAATELDQVQKIFQEIGVTRIESFDPDAWKNKVSHEVGIDRMYRIYYSSNAHPLGVTLRLLQTGLVETASPQYIFTPQVSKHIPDDPNYNQQWYLDTVHVPEAWTISMGDPSIVIADVDEGVNYNHEDIAANMVDHGYDATNVTSDCMPQTSQNEGSHGTETTGCFGAVADNKKGIAGVAPKCKVLGVKIANAAGQLTAGYEGIHIASAHHANVINCSWGGTVDASALAFEQKFADEVTKNNEVLVASAGNYSKNNDITPFYPANLTGALSVGASGLQNKPTSFTHFGTSVLCYAPGEHIATTTFPGNTAYDETDPSNVSTGGIAGTSFSGPIVAGVCALVMATDPTLPADAVKKIVTETGDMMNQQGRPDLYTGKKVNAFSALNAIAHPSKPSIAAVGYKFETSNDSVLDQYDVNETLEIELKNSQSPGTNDMTVTLLPGAGYTWDDFDPLTTANWPSQIIGAMDQKQQALFKLLKPVRRTRQFSEGHVSMRFALDAQNYRDTTTIAVPLTKQSGMDHRIQVAHGTCLKQLDARNAWAGFGYWLTIHDPETGRDTTFRITAFARRGLLGNTAKSRWELPREITGVGAPILCIDATDSMHCWFGGGAGAADTNEIFFTSDGGDSWGVNEFPVLPKWIHFYDNQNGMFVSDEVGNSFGSYSTTDGGVSWKKDPGIPGPYPNEHTFFNAAYWSGDTCWFGGDSGAVHYALGRGRSFITQRLDGSGTGLYARLKRVTEIAFNRTKSLGVAIVRPFDERFTDSAGIFVTGTRGVGAWSHLDIIDPNTNKIDRTAIPYSVTFKPESDTAIITTNHGAFKVAVTNPSNNPTSVWTYLSAPSSWNPDNSMIGAAGTKSEYTISAVSEGSGIAEFTTSALAPPAKVASSSANQLAISAYPNPSNGTADISFSLPAEGNVRMEIVDMLGRTVQKLDGEFMPSGLHTVRANLSAVAAGAYRCIVTSDNGLVGTTSLIVK